MELEEITLREADSVATIAPARGAIVTSFAVAGREILFMDRSTLVDASKNVRGGIPVLFPTPGKLADDRWTHGSDAGAQKQHGFARALPWRVAGRDARSTTLALESSPTTRADYPWQFVYEMTCSVSAGRLRLDEKITNRDSRPMPCGAGFHPYFQVADADKARCRVATAARRAFDNVTKRETAVLGPIDLTVAEVDLHLLDHGSTSSALVMPSGTVTIRGSTDYTHWVVWTLAGRDFVCLEPWTCPGNAMNTGDRLTMIAPGATWSPWIEIVVELKS